MYRQAAEADVGYAPAYANWGMALAMSGEVDEGVEIYQKGLAHCHEKYPILLNLGCLYAKMAKYEPAAQTLEQFLQEVPDQFKARNGAIGHLYLCSVYMQLQQFEKACTHLLCSLTLNPEADQGAYALMEQTIGDLLPGAKDATLFCIAGISEMIAGEMEGAESWFRKALKINPAKAEAYFGVGMTLGQPQKDDSPFNNSTSTRLNNAVAAFMRAGELKPDWIEAHYRVGQLSLQLMDLEAPFRAAASFKKVIELGQQQNVTNEFTTSAAELLEKHEVLRQLNR